MVTYEAMNLMVSFATLIVAVIPIGISSNKKK
ncbi:putative holin-like toxin [Mesobacillus subterraneus]|nr:putative holin-like toxin [Mesobacillus subterraneus]